MSLEKLAQDWKRDPSPATTIALCDALRANPDGPLVHQVGEFATARLASDIAVLVSVARMYMEAQRSADAQGVLVAAGKLAPRDPEVYRWLGEVLLRRGDADRAEKVLTRAVQLGSKDAETKIWLERARVFRPMQAKAGAQAVAAELAQAMAPPPRDLLDSMSETTTGVTARSALTGSPRGSEAPLPRFPEPSAPDDTEVHAREAEDSAETIILDDLPESTGPAVPARVAAALTLGARADAFAAPREAPGSAGPVPVPHPRDVLDAL